MAGVLDAPTVLGLLRRIGDTLREAEDAEEGLRRVVEILVPAVADRATVYAVDNDGRLHVLVSDVEDEGVDVSLDPGADHPAAAACRERAVAFVGKGGGSARVDGARFPSDAEALEVALPLQRGGGTVGAMCLSIEDRGRSYDAEDLGHLRDLGQQVSDGLEGVRLRKEVTGARRVKSDFLSVMSHELRTPLTAVVGYADLLEAGIPGPVTEKQVRQLERIKESAWELLELIDGILGYARYEGEEPELIVSIQHPRDVVQDAVTLVRPKLEEKGLDLTVEMDEDLPPLQTDREKAARVLFHLLSNAEKFTEHGRVTVRVTAERDWIVFVVADTGPGIAGAEVGQIFEPFWQGEQAETRTKGGTGMGLSLSRRLAQLLSGEISVESEPGSGSTFTFRLPRQGPHPTFK